VQRQGGLLVLDDSTLEKPDAQQIALVSRHGSGKQHAVVQGIKGNYHTLPLSKTFPTKSLSFAKAIPLKAGPCLFWDRRAGLAVSTSC